MQELEQIGLDASGAPVVLDWKHFFMKYIVPTYHHYPTVARKVCDPQPITFDGKTKGTIPVGYDIDDPNYLMYPAHKDTKVQADTVDVPLPQFSLTTLLTDDEMALPIAQRQRLIMWAQKATKKIAQWEDIVAFRGSTAMGVKGFISTDSYDLGSPTGLWGVDTGTNGVLDNAWDDLNLVIDYFSNAGLQEIPIHIVLTSYAYNLLRAKFILYTNKTNLDLWMTILPKGSTIRQSNNIQASVTKDANSMCALLDLQGENLGGYQLFSSGIQQKVHQTDLWEHRYGLREKFSVKVVDDAYICWMDGIDRDAS